MHGRNPLINGGFRPFFGPQSFFLDAPEGAWFKRSINEQRINERLITGDTMLTKFKNRLSEINRDEALALILIIVGTNAFIYWGWTTLRR